MTLFSVVRLVAALLVFVTLFILGPDNKVSKWLFPIAGLLTLLVYSIEREWMAVFIFLVAYGYIYLRYTKGQHPPK